MVYFISGHRDITKEEFEKHYVGKIKSVIQEEMDDMICDTRAYFVVGDYYGVDIMAQDWLCENGFADKVTVYHMFEKPRNINPLITHIKGGYESDEERDSAMTNDSDFDIAFVRNGKWKDSGTAINIRRRISFD